MIIFPFHLHDVVSILYTIYTFMFNKNVRPLHILTRSVFKNFNIFQLLVVHLIIIRILQLDQYMIHYVVSVS